MSKEKFIQEVIRITGYWKKTQPLLAEEMKKKIIDYLTPQKAATLNDFVLAMNMALNNIKTPMEDIFINWKKSREMPSYYTLKTSIYVYCND